MDEVYTPINTKSSAPSSSSNKTLRLPSEAFLATPSESGISSMGSLSPYGTPTPMTTSTPGSALSALQESYDMRCGDRIAIGGYGFIYTARCRDSGQTVVVKHVIKPPYEGRFTDTPKCDVEAELLHKCKNLGLNNIKSCSGGVTTIFDAYSDIDSLYMVCKYEGNDLQRIIESTYCGGEDSTSSPSTLDWYTIRDSVLGTLTALHHCGILHNDIRPENITYYTDQDFNNRSTTAKSTNPTVKLIDFGLSTTCHCPAHCKLLSHSHEYANATNGIRQSAIRQAWLNCTDDEFKLCSEIECTNAIEMIEDLSGIDNDEAEWVGDATEDVAAIFTPSVTHSL
ncbi:NUAK SNF1-like kinase 1 [Perkinsus chesapeaki]|uniref:NUAK SNF1-like kinase 1 n=1 Tax=Perkinsus chesapeaki TaxID=330153 RepID=A0A7J6MXM2_PERCH|nr:NUAK SNF1-like kinase 1 [Perkinsus chesapeaki]